MAVISKETSSRVMRKVIKMLETVRKSNPEVKRLLYRLRVKHLVSLWVYEGKALIGGKYV